MPSASPQKRRCPYSTPWISGPHFYSICGNDQIQKLITEGFCEVPYGPAANYPGYEHTCRRSDGSGSCYAAGAIAAGYVFKADTVAELAEKMGLDPEALAAAGACNAAC